MSPIPNPTMTLKIAKKLGDLAPPAKTSKSPTATSAFPMSIATRLPKRSPKYPEDKFPTALP